MTTTHFFGENPITPLYISCWSYCKSLRFFFLVRLISSLKGLAKYVRFSLPNPKKESYGYKNIISCKPTDDFFPITKFHGSLQEPVTALNVCEHQKGFPQSRPAWGGASAHRCYSTRNIHTLNEKFWGLAVSLRDSRVFAAGSVVKRRGP